MTEKRRVGELSAVPTAVYLDDTNGRFDRDGPDHHSLNDCRTDCDAAVGRTHTSDQACWREDPILQQRVDGASEVTLDRCLVDVVDEALREVLARGTRGDARPCIATERRFATP